MAHKVILGKSRKQACGRNIQSAHPTAMPYGEFCSQTGLHGKDTGWATERTATSRPSQTDRIPVEDVWKFSSTCMFFCNIKKKKSLKTTL